MKYKYRLRENGECSDLIVMGLNETLEEGWLEGELEGDSMPDINTIHTGEYKATLEAEVYKEQRRLEFPSIAEQFDYIYHHGVEAWKTNVIKPVKDKYPKPE